MNADQVIEGIGRAVAAANPAQEYCLFYWNVWPMCMTKAEWAGWMQAIGVLATIFSLTLGIISEKKKYREEVNKRKLADSVSIKYYLRQHHNFSSAIESFIYWHTCSYSDFQNKVKEGHQGKIIESSIVCFSMTEQFFNQMLQSADDLRFNERTDLHLNTYAGAMENILSAISSLKYPFEKYANQKENIQELIAEKNEINNGDYQIYWDKIIAYHQEWQIYPNVTRSYFKKIEDNWEEIINGVSSIKRKNSQS